MNESPVLGLAGLAVIGLLARRLPPLGWRRVATLDLVLAAGGLVLLGLVLGPGIGLLGRATLRALAPVTALAIGWIGAALGARFERRVVRRIPRGAWLVAGLSAAGAFVSVALGAWILARFIPGLAAAWAPPLPAILTLGAVAAASGPGAVHQVGRALGVSTPVARAVTLVATLETAVGAVALGVPLALHRLHPPAGSPALGWLVWTASALAAGGLVALVFLALARLGPGRGDPGSALLATLLFGAGIGYAADLSPFVVCGVAAGILVNVSPERRVVRQVLARWERPISAVFLVLAGALLTLPTLWILVAGPVLALLRAAGKWASVHYGRVVLKGTAVPPQAGLGTLAQGDAAVALALTFFLSYGAQNPGAGGAVATTILLGVAVTLSAAPAALELALRAGPAPLVRAAGVPELSPNAPGD